MKKYDIIIIGAGHNSLVAACYLQKQGFNTLVLEARPIIGGCCVTEEIWPGYKVSSLSYVNSLFHPKIIKDLKLHKHGLVLIKRDPSSFTPMLDGQYLLFHGNQEKTQEEIAKFSKNDAYVYPVYEEHIEKLASFINPLLLNPPPDILSNNIFDVWQCVRLALRAKGMGEDIFDQIRILSMSAADFIERYFESEPLKATLASDGVIGAFAGPRTPGTAYVLLHHVLGEAFGQRGVWAYVKGGMGGLTQSLAHSFISLGGTIEISSPVDRILVYNQRVFGVVLKDGIEIPANYVVSGTDPQRTFLNMIESVHLEQKFLEDVKKINFKSASMKINFALNGVPNWKCIPTNGKTGPHHHGTVHLNSENINDIEQAFDDAKQGKASRKPMLECTMASVLDGTLAPENKHIMSVFVQYVPMGALQSQKEKDIFVNSCIDQIDQYAPGFKNLVEHVHTLSPEDLEKEYHLTGGNIFQGAMTLEQLYFMRPLPQCSRYRTPIKNLYLCGSCTHPGGGVTGACGHNAAKMIISDME